MGRTDSIHEGIRFLAGVCDFAYTRDGQGFSGVDTGLGHYLAGLAPDQWTPAQKREGWNLTRKYRRQLEEAGFDVDAMPEPPNPNGGGNVRQQAQTDRVAQKRGEITVRNGEVVKRSDNRLEVATLTDHTFGTELRFVLAFPYEQTWVDAARNIHGRVYHSRDRTNSYPMHPDAARGLRAFIADKEFDVSTEAQTALDELSDPDAPPPAWGTVRLEEGGFVVDFPYEREVVAALQKVNGRRWDGRRKVNIVPLRPRAGLELATFLREQDRRGWDVSEDAQAEMARLVEEGRAEAAKREERLEISRAEDAKINVEGLGGTLRPFQRGGVAYVRHANGRTFIGDDQGTGKTVQALAAIHDAEAYPAVVVCQATMKRPWADHVAGPKRWFPGHPVPKEGWLPGKKVRVLSGRKPQAGALRGADVVVINYDILGAWLPMLKAMRPKALVLDESHFVKEKGTRKNPVQRTKAAHELAGTVIAKRGMVLLLSGTILKSRPVELVSQLEIMDRLDDFGGFWPFVKRYCGAYKNGQYWDFSGATHTEELHQKLRETCMIRRRKADVMKELPAKQIAHINVELDNMGEYVQVEDDVIAFLRSEVARDEEIRREALEQATAKHPDDEEARDKEARRIVREQQAEAEARAKRAERLVQLNKLREVAARGKITAAREWIESFLEGSDEKLIVFAEHVEVQKAMLSAVRKYRPARVLGEDGHEQRSAEIDRFQTDPNCRVIVCSLRAAGTGITLTAASNVVFIEQAWTPADMHQAEDRAHRIGQEDQVTAWYLLAEDTVDEDMAALLAEKRRVIEAVLDGGADPGRINIASELVDRLLAGRNGDG